MVPSRRSFLRGIASVAGVAGVQTAHAQHEGHPAGAQGAAPPTAAQVRPRNDVPLPPGSLGEGVVPVVTPDVPDMPWRLRGSATLFGGAALTSVEMRWDNRRPSFTGRAS